MTAEDVTGRIVPALMRALASADERDSDLRCACLIALARTSRPTDRGDLVDLLAGQLADAPWEVREAAMLALGLAGPFAGGERQLDLLAAISRADAAGRHLCGDIDDRMRSFAAFALGLLAARCDAAALQDRILDVLVGLLDDPGVTSPDVRVAAISSIGLLGHGPNGRAPAALRHRAVGHLERLLGRELAADDELVAAHCPTAIARLLDPDERAAARLRARFVDELGGRVPWSRCTDHIRRSCAQALGALCRPPDAGGRDDAFGSAALLEAWRTHVDPQTRHFALVALGEIGGEPNREALLAIFAAADGEGRYWCALALGVLGHRLRQRAAAGGIGGEEDAARLRAIAVALRNALLAEPRNSHRVPLAIGLGLCSDAAAAPILLGELRQQPRNGEVAACLSTALALLGCADARAPLRERLEPATHRGDPEFVLAAAEALAALGEDETTPVLLRRLAAAGANLPLVFGATRALGLVGDRRAIDALAGRLGDPDVDRLTGAFCASALGDLGAADRTPWNDCLAAGFNYRASTPTLTDRQSGVLDLF